MSGDHASLRAIGLSESAAEAKSRLFARARAALDALRAADPSDSRDARAFWVPGRVEFLGKHTDYAGGPSLICALERGFAVAAIPRDDRRVCIRDACSGERADTELDASLTCGPRAASARSTSVS